MELKEESAKIYGLSFERYSASSDIASDCLEGWENGTLNKPAIIKKVSEEAHDKTEAAMIGLFVGHMME